MNAAQYRAKLEARKAQIQRMQETPEGRNSLMLKTHLNSVVGEQIALDSGEHFAHQPGDTAARIVLSDLQRSLTKKLNQ